MLKCVQVYANVCEPMHKCMIKPHAVSSEVKQVQKRRESVKADLKQRQKRERAGFPRQSGARTSAATKDDPVKVFAIQLGIAQTLQCSFATTSSCMIDRKVVHVVNKPY